MDLSIEDGVEPTDLCRCINTGLAKESEAKTEQKMIWNNTITKHLQNKILKSACHTKQRDTDNKTQGCVRKEL